MKRTALLFLAMGATLAVGQQIANGQRSPAAKVSWRQVTRSAPGYAAAP